MARGGEARAARSGVAYVDVGTVYGDREAMTLLSLRRGTPRQRLFMHDGRTSNLVEAINAHGGEAARVINNFKSLSVGGDAPFNLTGTEQQNLVLFVRSL